MMAAKKDGTPPMLKGGVVSEQSQWEWWVGRRRERQRRRRATYLTWTATFGIYALMFYAFYGINHWY